MNGVGVRVREMLDNGRFWSGILCAASFSRGTAYIERPPAIPNAAGRAIETYIPYPVWGWILLVTMTMIVIGHLFSHLRWFGIAGHTLSVIAYGTFGLSLGLSAIGTGESWANTGLFLSAALLHVNCSIYMADEIAGHKNGGGD